MENFDARWAAVERQLQERFGKVPDLDGLLFLIGMNEYGRPPRRSKFTKEEKQDLMHVAVCTLLGRRGYFQLLGRDADGWPHFEPTGAAPPWGMEAQERLLKECAVEYFEEA